ncbi:MAG: type ISP restriction/modification enzyme [Chloroherpetonaceae bacterium]|nr:type ISP restriction/modification enzyme [Chloroherpetonaceae bacterium]
MSKLLIQTYYKNLERVRHFGKTTNETSIRNHFWNLLNGYAQKSNFEVIPEAACLGTKGKQVRPDGILKNSFGIDIGLWESKDEKDDIDAEIEVKRQKGYPFSNILFEDSSTAILFQYQEEVMRIDISNETKLDELLTRFITFKNETIEQFETALENFKADIPAIVEALREKIESARRHNEPFLKAGQEFLVLCQAEINPDITEADIREMMIQHILTSDIFNKIFDDADFHRHNNIARELEKLIELLFSRTERKNLLTQIEHYYDAINAAAAGISDHHEKQKFLKVLYENFYKVYNPKAADKLGVVYTPNEIVKFMIESTDALLFQHFGKTLSDRDVEILDPATGTGTFITALIDHIPLRDLEYKYKHEIHANEVAILPYYIANLNIEFTYKQRTGRYEEFNNLCFVDTLDNIGALSYEGNKQQNNLFALSSENSERIKRQNSKKISVVIGNPPYNANQLNENDNNKNREYPFIDKEIKETFIKQSTAQKTKVYDMYARFYRWAMNRITSKGVIAFITNRSFIDSRTFDGFRKCVQNDFAECYIIDTKSDVRANPKIAGTTHNVFGIQTGVAIMFLVRKDKQSGNCKIYYVALDDFWRKEEKLDWLRQNKFEKIQFETVSPDKNGNWINLADTDFDTLLPLADKNTKLAKEKKQEKAVFKLFSLGVVTNRDEWVYDFDDKDLEKKVKFFCEFYEKEKARWERSNKKLPLNDFVDRTIKWTEELEAHLERGSELHLDKKMIRESLYRPFVKQFTYYDRIITHRLYQNNVIFPIGRREDNKVICISGTASSKPFSCIASQTLSGLDLLEKTQCLPLYRYTESGERVDNITDWGLAQFRAHYEPSPQPSPSGRGSKSGSISSPLPLGEDLGEGKKRKLPENLLQTARELRKNATDAEKLMWSLLRNRQLNGYKFRRQHPFGRFILDFYCHESKLCVELDGGQHAEKNQAEYDAARTEVLNQNGIRVIRFWNNEVFTNTEGVLMNIIEHLEKSPIITSPLLSEDDSRSVSNPSPLPLGEDLGEGKFRSSDKVSSEIPSKEDLGEGKTITKEAIFHYTYAVLHHPAYRKKYELNLKREFPRLPFYEDFWKWENWGKTLMELHINFETAPSFGLKRMEVKSDDASKKQKPKLKVDKERGWIIIDDETTLTGVPKEAWEYKLGNRSALEWICDQYKESTPKDKTIAEKFNTYQFATYKEKVIDLLQRVTTVSVETMKIVQGMPSSAE